MLAVGDTLPQQRPGLAAADASGLLSRLQYPLLTVALLVFLWLGWRGRVPIGIGTLDENIYLSLSQSLASGSYREIYLASNPLHVKYPPGYPAFLSVVRLVGGDNLDVIRAVNLVILAGSILLLYLIVRHVAGVGVALSVAFLLSINHTLLAIGGTVLSESLFLGLSTATLYLAVRADPGRHRLAYWVIGLAMASFLTRTAGIALVTAVGVWLLGRRRRPELLTYVAASALVVGGWITYTALVPDRAGGTSYWLDVSTSGVGRATNPVLWLIQSTLRHFGFYAVRTIPSGLAVPTIEGTRIDNAVWLGVSTVLITVGTFAFWTRARAVAVYLVLYAGLVATWPWLQARVVMPLIPLAMAALLVGAHHLGRRLPAPARNAALAILVLLLGVGGLQMTLERDALVRKCDLAHPYESEGCLDPVTRGLARASLYIRDHTPPDAVIVSIKAPGVNYLSGRLTELPSFLDKAPKGHAVQLLRDRRIHYLLLSGQLSTMVWVGRALLPECAELRVVGTFAPQVTLLTTDVSGGTSEDACPVLTALAKSGRAE